MNVPTAAPRNAIAGAAAATIPAPPSRRHAAAIGAAFLALSLCLMAGLFLTVHRRDLGTVLQAKQASLDQAQMRYDDTVERWLNKGFMHEGGMIFLKHGLAKAHYPNAVPDDALVKPDSVFAWRNTTAAWLIPLYVMEAAQKAFTGTFSHGLVIVYNQLAVALAAAALGLLAMRIAGRMGLGRFHAFLIGAACLAVYQTFPANLWLYWESSPLPFPILFALLFLSLEFGAWPQPRPALRQALRGVLATLVIFGEPVTGGMFVAFYLAMRAVLEPRGVAPGDVTALFIVPVALVACYLTLQGLLVRNYHDSVFFVGSTLPFRTGLDGDFRYYSDHWDLLLRNLFLFKPGWPLANIVWWPWLFTAAILSAAALLARYRQVPLLREPLKILIATVGLYLPFAMAMSQAAAIHPYHWDSCLVIPCILSVFCLLPAWREARAPTGLPVFTTVVAAAAYCFVQLRTYALAYPLA